MAFCPNCGKPIEATDKFCKNCGSALKGGNAASLQWEYCEIVYNSRSESNWPFTEKDFFFFWASAIGSKGKYTAARSEVIAGSSYPHQSHVDVLNMFVKKIVGDGWEALPDKGAHWYSYKFRRQVKG